MGDKNKYKNGGENKIVFYIFISIHNLQVVSLLHGILDLCGIGTEDKALIFRQNAIQFYKINI